VRLASQVSQVRIPRLAPGFRGRVGNCRLAISSRSRNGSWWLLCWGGVLNWIQQLPRTSHTGLVAYLVFRPSQVIGPARDSVADPRILSWGTETETDCEHENSIGLKQQQESIEANRKPAVGSRFLHPAERTVCCRLIRFLLHGTGCLGEILRFSTVSSPEVRSERDADVHFQVVWAHVSNPKLQVSPRGASDLWRQLVRKSVSVHQDKIRGSAIGGPHIARSMLFHRYGTLESHIIPRIA